MRWLLEIRKTPENRELFQQKQGGYWQKVANCYEGLMTWGYFSASK
jgi:hypothetical protein